jgi:NapC/NirT cytochrome c family, N-terminal region
VTGDVRLIRSPISVAGMVLTTISAVLFLVVFLADLFGLHTNPYIGIVFFLVLPAIFVAGLVLIPFGAWVERRRRAAGKAPSAMYWPRIDLNDPKQRSIALGIFALTLANIVIVSLAAYRGVEYMDSPQFCGQVCHTVMQPEFVAHERQPHARVKCVDCHVGPGASSFAKAKVAGTRRVLAVTFHRYPRPIVAPADKLLSARDTCEQCHWSERFHGDKVRRIAEYANDETNTESVTTLRVHVGGGDPRLGTATGIHWHMNLANEIEYIASDNERQVIPYVRMKDAGGNVREYLADGVTAEQVATGERRRFECVDCHNRPSHSIAATPERAVNEAMARGDIPRTLPFIHREAVKALKASHASRDLAFAEISRALREFYRTEQSQQSATRAAEIERAVLATQDLYRRNVFPEMNVRFGVYANNIGHIDFPGCFRCHDDNHTSKDGKKIGQDCETCHAIE